MVTVTNLSSKYLHHVSSLIAKPYERLLQTKTVSANFAETFIMTEQIERFANYKCDRYQVILVFSYKDVFKVYSC